MINWVQFLQCPPPKICDGKKSLQNFSPFLTTIDFDREYLRKGSTYQKPEKLLIIYNYFHVGWKKLMYFGPQTKKLWSLMYLHPNGLISRDYISALRGRCALTFLHMLEIDQGLLAHTQRGEPPPKKKSWKLKIWLKILRATVHNVRDSGSIFTKLFLCDLPLLREEFRLPEIEFALGLRRRAASRLALPCPSFSIWNYSSVIQDYWQWYYSIDYYYYYYFFSPRYIWLLLFFYTLGSKDPDGEKLKTKIK